MSVLSRVWRKACNAVKPPPAAGGVTAETRRQRRVIAAAGVLAIAIMAGSWAAYRYIASAQTRAESEFDEGARFMATGNFKSAEERFTKAAEIWPQMISVYYQRGLARQSMNSLDAAMEDFQQAISVGANAGPAHTALGEIYRSKGDATRAIDEFTRSLSVASNMNALYQRGQLYESLGQHEKAIADYDAAIDRHPDFPYVYLARALSRDSAGDHDGAEADRQQAQQIARR